MSAKILALAALLLSGCAPAAVSRPAPKAATGAARLAACAGIDDWDTPGPPVRIHGGTYYVGTCGITAILVTGDQGHVLIDSGTDKGADGVLANIRALGIDPRAVKILLSTHEHVDHVGGLARIQRATGARLYASPEAARALASGTVSPDDPQAGSFGPFPAARVDYRLRDGEVVRLGRLAITTLFTPGHTLGATSWRWRSCDGTHCKTIVYADSLNPISRDGYRFSDHPALVDAYRRGLATIAASPCDIVLSDHPGASDLNERLAGVKPLVDAGGCRAYAGRISARLDARLAKEKR